MFLFLRIFASLLIVNVFAPVFPESDAGTKDPCLTLESLRNAAVYVLPRVFTQQRVHPQRFVRQASLEALPSSRGSQVLGVQQPQTVRRRSALVSKAESDDRITRWLAETGEASGNINDVREVRRDGQVQAIGALPQTLLVHRVTARPDQIWLKTYMINLAQQFLAASINENRDRLQELFKKQNECIKESKKLIFTKNIDKFKRLSEEFVKINNEIDQIFAHRELLLFQSNYCLSVALLY